MSLVSFESRYGTCLSPSLSARTTFRSALRLLLISALSFIRSPSFPVLRLFSDPARSLLVAQVSTTPNFAARSVGVGRT